MKTAYTFEGTLRSEKMHAECHQAFMDEFKHYPSGTTLGFDPHANERGHAAKEDTIWEV